jgi:Domain of unknown function (DUF4349)/Putative zinc-finger
MSTTIHPVAPEEVMAFLDGELSSEESVSIGTHLETCSDCKELTAKLRSTSQSLSQWQIGGPKASLQELIVNAANGQPWALVRPAWPLYFQRLFSRRLPWALACLAMVLLIGMRLSTSRFARPVSVDKSEPYHSVLLTNPPSPTGIYEISGHNAAAGAGGEYGDSSFGIQRAQADDATKSLSLPSGPMIARTVALSIVVKDFDTGRASLDAILARHNGYAGSLNASTPQGSARTLQASLRIPAPQLAQALSELKTLGRVENENQNGEEVTQQHADLVARLKNSRETEQRLQDVLRTRTGKVKEVLEVEQEIARVRGEIEQMEAEQKTLEHRVEFATIDLKLAEEYKAQLNTPAPSILMQLRNAAVNGFRNAFESLLALVLFLAESGPSLLLWLALLGIPAWRLWRRYRRGQSLGSLAGA